MNISCDIIEDLMPLYCDNICSIQSKKIVEEHLNECNECRKKMDIMKEDYHINELIINDDIYSKKVIKKVIRHIVRKTTLSLSYIFGIVMFWIVFALQQSSWISDKSYVIHEILSLFIFIGMIAITIATIIYIIDCIVKIIKKQAVNRYLKRMLFIILIFSIQIGMIKYQYSYRHVEGYSAIEKKEIIDDMCYIYVHNGKILSRLKCTFDEYERIEVNDLLGYHISYKYNTFTPEKGKLKFILTSETIDNRLNNNFPENK